jgi:hypothetical protein
LEEEREGEEKEQQVFSVTAPGLRGVYRGEEFEIIRKLKSIRELDIHLITQFQMKISSCALFHDGSVP